MDFFSAPQESRAEKQLKPLLLDEGCHVLSTFELNQIASLTYGDLVCDEIFELMEKMFSRPIEYTPLTIQKTLVVLKHILIYGSEKCVNSGYGIGAFVQNLTTYNTVLLAQQQKGTGAFFQRLKGGGVDHGGPVREAATAVQQLLSNIHELQRIRNERASKESLVPIGSDKIGFITDDVRHYLLKRKIEEHQKIHIKSNLAKSAGGFGGGYNATDGKNVVGAAHGIEEMVKIATRNKRQFSDDGPVGPSEEEKILAELLAEAKAAEAEKKKAEDARKAAQNEALLGGLNPMSSKPVGDLLDFGGGDLLGGSTGTPAPAQSSSGVHDFFGMTSTAPAPAHSDDLLGLGRGNDNLIGAASTTQAVDLFAPVTQVPNTSSTSIGGVGGDLLGMATVTPTTAAVDPFASMAINAAPVNNPSPALALSSDSTGIASMMTNMDISSGQNTQKKPVMASNKDRFSALDALASTSLPKVTALDAKNAENRLLGATTTPVPVTATSLPVISSGVVGFSNPPSLPTQHSPMPHVESFTAVPSDVPPLPMGMPVAIPPVPMVQAGLGRVAANYGDASDDDDNPWVMGGSAGAGLEPTAPPPGAPPPPPSS